jgi:hypothetical protein
MPWFLQEKVFRQLHPISCIKCLLYWMEIMDTSWTIGNQFKNVTVTVTVTNKTRLIYGDFFILCTFLMLSHTICTGSGVICIAIFDVHWSEYFAGNLEYTCTSTDKWVSWLHSQIAQNGNFWSWMSEKNMKIILDEKIGIF